MNSTKVRIHCTITQVLLETKPYKGGDGSVRDRVEYALILKTPTGPLRVKADSVTEGQKIAELLEYLGVQGTQ